MLPAFNLANGTSLNPWSTGVARAAFASESRDGLISHLLSSLVGCHLVAVALGGVFLFSGGLLSHAVNAVPRKIRNEEIKIRIGDLLARGCHELAVENRDRVRPVVQSPGIGTPACLGYCFNRSALLRHEPHRPPSLDKYTTRTQRQPCSVTWSYSRRRSDICGTARRRSCRKQLDQ